MSKQSTDTYIRTRDGVSLYWKAWGRGAPVLFAHSWAVPSAMWDYQLAELGDHMRCFTFDRRGHGRSDCPAEGYDYDTLADDLASVIGALELDGLTLVGHSMGACEIVRYLTRHGNARVKRIILISPTMPFLMQTPDNPAGVPKVAFDALRESWKKDFPKWVADKTVPFFYPATSPQMMQWGMNLMLQTPVPVAIECNRSVTGTDFRAELRKITVPTLLIHGDTDASAPLDFTGKAAAALIPGCTLKVYEGGPHGLMFTHPERLNADIRAFVGA